MPGYVNGIPHATSTDRIDLWPTTSRNLAQWIDGNMLRDDDPRMTNARPPTAHTHHRIDNPHGHATLDAGGGFQHWVNDTRVWWVDADGVLREGSVGLLKNRVARLTLDGSGGVQHWVNDTRVWWVNDQGRLEQGTVPLSALEAMPGWLENRIARLTLDGSGGVQHWVNDTRVWWHDHTGRLIKGAVPWSLIDGAPELTQPATLKVTPLALTTGQSNALHNAAQSVRVPVRFNAPLVRWRLHVRNWNPRTGTVTAAPVDFTGMWLADTSGAGVISGAPTQISPAFTTPENGDEWVSEWVDTPLGGDVERLLCFGYTSTTPPPRLIGGSYQNHDPAQAISGAAHGANSVSPFDMWIEAETPATTPVIAGIGDSMTSGTGATLPVHESWVSQYARSVGGLPLHVSHHGDSMNGFLTTNPGKVTRWDHLARADAVVWGLGQNDIGDGRTLSQMQTDFQTLRPIVESAVGPVAYMSTIQPRNAWGSEKEDERIAWNEWIAQQGFRGILDFASVVSDDGDTLRPEYDSGDGGHLNTAGYAAEAASITVPLTAPSPARQLQLLEARISALEGNPATLTTDQETPQ